MEIGAEQIYEQAIGHFRNRFMHIPTQIIRQGRKIIYRLLCWKPELPIFFRALDRLQARALC